MRALLHRLSDAAAHLAKRNERQASEPPMQPMQSNDLIARQELAHMLNTYEESFAALGQDLDEMAPLRSRALK